MHWSHGGTCADKLSAHLISIFPFYFFFCLFSHLVLCPPGNPSCTSLSRSNAYNPTFHPTPRPSPTLTLLSLLPLHFRDDNGPETRSPTLFSLHLPPSAPIGPPRRTRPANSHPWPALVIKAASSYTSSLSEPAQSPDPLIAQQAKDQFSRPSVAPDACCASAP